jgi:NAD(P)-dependent dehydrogenase (short-subunit alcohol dehydrogenase family)
MEMARRSVIVTGAAGTMGSAAVGALAARGVNLLCVDRDARGLDRVAGNITPVGDAELVTIAADVADAAQVESFIGEARTRWKNLSGVFNIAGIGGHVAPVTESTDENYDEVMRVNARSVWLSMKYALPLLIESGGGAIVNTGSYLAIRGEPGLAAYAASKHAIVGMTKTVALEYATSNIRANVVCPGSMDTPMIRLMFHAVSPDDLAAGEALTTDKIPQKRLAAPDELASVGTWLLLDAPEHLSGQVLAVDGARSAG